MKRKATICSDETQKEILDYIEDLIRDNFCEFEDEIGGYDLVRKPRSFTLELNLEVRNP